MYSMYYTIQSSPAIKIVRKSVVQECALLEVGEVDRLRREVEVLRWALVAADRLPWT